MLEQFPLGGISDRFVINTGSGDGAILTDAYSTDMAHSQRLHITTAHGVVMIPHLIAHTNHAAVCQDTNGGAIACRDSNYIFPLGYISAALAVVACGKM